MYIDRAAAAAAAKNLDINDIIEHWQNKKRKAAFRLSLRKMPPYPTGVIQVFLYYYEANKKENINQ